MTVSSAEDMIPAWVDGALTPVPKLEVHQRGLRHKAVSVFVLDAGRVLIQRRALGKYHTPGLWANTCCTHPRWDEDPAHCAVRRLAEELGISGLFPAFADQVEYRADVGAGLIEHELVDIFTAEAGPDLRVVPNPDEVMETRLHDRAYGPDFRRLGRSRALGLRGKPGQQDRRHLIWHFLMEQMAKPCDFGIGRVRHMGDRIARHLGRHGGVAVGRDQKHRVLQRGQAGHKPIQPPLRHHAQRAADMGRVAHQRKVLRGCPRVSTPPCQQKAWPPRRVPSAETSPPPPRQRCQGRH